MGKNSIKKGWFDPAYFHFFLLSSLIFAIFTIVFHLHFIYLPIFFFCLGLISYLINEKLSISIFVFFLPLINASPDLFFNGLPYNYMGISLFYLSGIYVAFLCRGHRFDLKEIWIKPYLVLLALLFISAFFLFLRWSNLTLSTLAFMKDTLVEPSGNRTSFAFIFPVITLFLFAFTPVIYLLIKKYRFSLQDIFVPLLWGYYFSLLIALYQWKVDRDFLSQSWWGNKLNRFNGGFSDFNGFGLFSGVLFAYSTLTMLDKMTEKNGRRLLLPTLFFPLITLAGIFLSGSRTAMIFIGAAFLYFLGHKKISRKTKIVVVILVLLAAVFAGGTLKDRIKQNIKVFTGMGEKTDLWQALDKASNARLTMIANSWKIFKAYPFSGIGAGNFLFYLKYMHYGEKIVEDLPLNQYLLLLDELGIPGLFVFVVFLVFMYKGKRRSLFTFLWLVMLLVLFFNSFFWLPEGLILFWIISAFIHRENPIPGKEKNLHPRWFAYALIMSFIFFNIVSFSPLHPKNWVVDKGLIYDYGLWYREQDERGVYCWTKDKSGLYIRNSVQRQVKIWCGAPLEHLPGKKQQVVVFWQGRRVKKIIFTANRFEVFHLPAKQRGFLEFYTQPTFNLQKMGLGIEKRDLGVQFYYPELMKKKGGNLGE